MKLELQVDVEIFKKPEDGPESWNNTGRRCSICQEEFSSYYYSDEVDQGHSLMECLQGLVRRIKKLENPNA